MKSPRAATPTKAPREPVRARVPTTPKRIPKSTYRDRREATARSMKMKGTPIRRTTPRSLASKV